MRDFWKPRRHRVTRGCFFRGAAGLAGSQPRLPPGRRPGTCGAQSTLSSSRPRRALTPRTRSRAVTGRSRLRDKKQSALRAERLAKSPARRSTSPTPLAVPGRRVVCAQHAAWWGRAPPLHSRSRRELLPLPGPHPSQRPSPPSLGRTKSSGTLEGGAVEPGRSCAR